MLKRLIAIAQRCYLRYQLAELDRAACNVEADMLAAPRRLIELRARITDLSNHLDHLKG